MTFDDFTYFKKIVIFVLKRPSKKTVFEKEEFRIILYLPILVMKILGQCQDFYFIFCICECQD